MPILHDFGNFQIYIYFRDHGEPHFHVVAPDYEAKVSINNPAIVAGELPSGVLRKVRRWAVANRAMLISRWNEQN